MAYKLRWLDSKWYGSLPLSHNLSVVSFLKGVKLKTCSEPDYIDVIQL